MDRIVTFVINGIDFSQEVKAAQCDEEAKAIVIARLSKSFHVTAITAVRPKKRTSLFATYSDGFKAFFSNLNLLPSR